MGVPVYRGPFGAPQAERLLWRAGFGPRQGEAEALAKLGLDGAVRSLIDPGPEKLVGPRPHDDKGRPLAPADAWGHDHCWWLDRMVRTSRPLVERMTLVWHDWFATSNDGVGNQALMIQQNDLFRFHAVGSFHRLLLDVTKDPAMLLWLNGTENVKGSPNENYAREMMELFTLGADRGAYTERDVREQARSLTGWQNSWKQGKGDYNFHFDARDHDEGMKTVFHKSGRFDWQDACRLCVSHPPHPSFFVNKLWSYFVPVAPSRSTLAGLEALYKQDYQVAPVVSAILKHPALIDGPRMVKPPVVHLAGLLRRIGARHHDDRLGVDRPARRAAALLSAERRRLGRHALARHGHVPRPLDRRPADPAGQPPRSGEAAEGIAGRRTRPAREAPSLSGGNPALSSGTHNALLHFAQASLHDARGQKWKQAQYPVLIENALRHLIAVSPDVQTS